jgi:hypothetical protein
MPILYRVSRPGHEAVTDAGSVEAASAAVRADSPDRYHVDQISSEPLPSGHTSRRWGIIFKHGDGTVVAEPDPWEA